MVVGVGVVDGSGGAVGSTAFQYHGISSPVAFQPT